MGGDKEKCQNWLFYNTSFTNRRGGGGGGGGNLTGYIDSAKTVKMF